MSTRECSYAYYCELPSKKLSEAIIRTQSKGKIVYSFNVPHSGEIITHIASSVDIPHTVLIDSILVNNRAQLVDDLRSIVPALNVFFFIE